MSSPLLFFRLQRVRVLVDQLFAGRFCCDFSLQHALRVLIYAGEVKDRQIPMFRIYTHS